MSNPVIYYKDDGTIVAVAMAPLLGDDLPENVNVFGISAPEAMMFHRGITPTDAWKIIVDSRTKSPVLKKIAGVRTNNNQLVVIGRMDDPELVVEKTDRLYLVPRASWKPSRMQMEFYITALGDPNVLISHRSVHGTLTERLVLDPIPDRPFMILTHPGIRVSYES